jgi:recombination protein RecA
MNTTARLPSASLSARLHRAATLQTAQAGQAGETADLRGWCLASLAGRLAELSAASASCSLTLASLLVAEAQGAGGGAAALRTPGGQAAWISAGPDTFFPPDLAANGVDLASLPVVRVPGARAAGRAADWLLRTGAFRLLVVDLGADLALPAALQARLAQLARRHATAVVFLTRKDPLVPSLGSLISLRAEALRTEVQRTEARRIEGRPQAEGQGGFTCSLRVLKDKRRSPGWSQRQLCDGPPGLC